MAKSVQTVLGDHEMEFVARALHKTGETYYAFSKRVILEEARKILSESEGNADAAVLEMVAALRTRKWALYQMQDYSDSNHRQWLKTRYPKAFPRQIEEAVTRFRNEQEHPLNKR